MLPSGSRLAEQQHNARTRGIGSKRAIAVREGRNSFRGTRYAQAPSAVSALPPPRSAPLLLSTALGRRRITKLRVV